MLGSAPRLAITGQSHSRMGKVKSLSLVQLFETPWTVAHQAPPSMGFSRQEYWSGLPFPSPGDLPNPGIEPRSPALQADALISEPPGKPIMGKPKTKIGKEERSRGPRTTSLCDDSRRQVCQCHSLKIDPEAQRGTGPWVSVHAEA